MRRKRHERRVRSFYRMLFILGVDVRFKRHTWTRKDVRRYMRREALRLAVKLIDYTECIEEDTIPITMKIEESPWTPRRAPRMEHGEIEEESISPIPAGLIPIIPIPAGLIFDVARAHDKYWREHAITREQLAATFQQAGVYHGRKP